MKVSLFDNSGHDDEIRKLKKQVRDIQSKLGIENDESEESEETPTEEALKLPIPNKHTEFKSQKISQFKGVDGKVYELVYDAWMNYLQAKAEKREEDAEKYSDITWITEAKYSIKYSKDFTKPVKQARYDAENDSKKSINKSGLK